MAATIALLGVLPAAADNRSDLYSAMVIVTGKDNLAERARGIGEAMPLVLTKLTVDRAVASRAEDQGLTDKAADLVDSYDYVDRKEGIQISDEQGTRERSFEMTVHFDTARIDAILAQLGAKAWLTPRPEVGVALLIDDGNSLYVLTEESEKGYGQRLALVDEAKALALPVKLPKAVSGDDVERIFSGIGRLSPVRLEGRMNLTKAGYWNSEWHFETDHGDDRFSYANTTFDRSIADALRRGAKALAKH